MTLIGEITLRPVAAADQPLLLQWYGSTRAAELALVPWNEVQRAAFVRLQFEAQSAFYQSEYPNAVHSIVQYGEESVGRLYVDRRSHEIRILDLTLQAHPQSEALGAQLIEPLMKEAKAKEVPLNIHLEPFNSLLALFERLGFVKVTDNGAHALYEWRAEH